MVVLLKLIILLFLNYGIFVIETKNMNGWIYGQEKDANWIQVSFKTKNSFQSPLRQNYKHTKTISELLKIPENKFHSVIFFIGDCKFKTKMPENVLQNGYIKYIKSKTDVVFTDHQVNSIIEGLTAYRLPSNFKTKKDHINNLKQNNKI